jgi:hypothetical protein
MLRFRQFNEYIIEGKYPNWVRVTTGLLVLKIRNLSIRIQREKDPKLQNDLIAQQNKLLSYIDGLSIGVGTDDAALLSKIKSYNR